MNWNIISVIIGREYMTRVKKKSFLLITFLGPLFFTAICVLPSIIMIAAKEEAKVIGVIDESGIVLPELTDSETIVYRNLESSPLDSVKTNLGEFGIDAVLHVSALDSVSKSLSAEAYSKKPLGMDMSMAIRAVVNDAVEKYRIESYGIENLSQIMKDVKPDINVATYTMDDSGKETISASEVYMGLSMVLGMIIYMFIAIFCGMVMSSVIEEKSSRVVEVLVSSVKSTELMFGKIIGVACVALTQFLLWIALTGVIVGAVGAFMGFDKLAGDPETVQMVSGVDPEMVTEMVQQNVSEGNALMSTLANLNFTQIGISFILFFVLGYLLYASLFAAIGSAVENEGDAGQLQMPVTIPLLIGFFIALYAYKSPDSAIVFWGSMIPFTSPIVMLARIPFGVPTWELVLSLVLLAVTFVLLAWASAKIYKIGILMFGKKTTFKDLWKWLKQK